jgi:cytochrome b561
MNTSTQRYDRTTVLFHWIVGSATLVQFALGVWMLDATRAPFRRAEATPRVPGAHPENG